MACSIGRNPRIRIQEGRNSFASTCESSHMYLNICSNIRKTRILRMAWASSAAHRYATFFIILHGPALCFFGDFRVW